MRILFRVASALSLVGIGLIATGIVLSGAGNLVSPEGVLLPNHHAALCFLIGPPVLWLGCGGTATVLRRSCAVLAGLVTVAGSFVVPWFLHAVGVTWWTYYSSLPAVAVVVAGCILLGVAAIRITLFRSSQVGRAVSGKLPLASLHVYLRPVVIGIALGLLANFCLVNWYRSPSAKAFATPAFADFEWDPAHGVTAFRLRDSTAGYPLWTRARESLIGLQIKPQLDWFMRLGPMRKSAGTAEVDIVRVIPFAIPAAWGSGGLCLGAGGCY